MGRIKIKTLIIVVAVYAGVIMSLQQMVQTGEIPGLIPRALAGYSLLCIISMMIMYQICAKRAQIDKIFFNKVYPLQSMGIQLADFQYIFYCEENIVDEVNIRIQNKLVSAAGLSDFRSIKMEDVDRHIKPRECRDLFFAAGPVNTWKTEIGFVLHACSRKKMQSIKWWIFAKGYTNYNKLFVMIAISPLLLPFILKPFINKTYNPSTESIELYSSFLNSFDIDTDARCLQKAAFEELVKILEEKGVDITDLNQQRASVLNITVKGGSAMFGSIVQGMKNKINLPAMGGTK